MIKLAVSGACGKMGTRIINLALNDKAFKLVSILEMDSHPSLNTELYGLKLTSDYGQLKKADVLIEFTSPSATIAHIKDCLLAKTALVIGTTGLSDDQKAIIKKASQKIPIVFSPNMSVGVNLLFSLVKEAAQKLSGNYSVRLTEAHHIHKKDAPSGTAKQLASIIQDNGTQKMADIKSIREGEIVGDHEVRFESEEDTFVLSHSAKTRDIFAQGALVAAKFVVNKKKGLFSMHDVMAKR